jgi:hypothetical protein
MKQFGILVSAFFLFIAGCNPNNEKETQEEFFPATPFIQNDVMDVDTSVYPIIKIEWTDRLSPDTSYVKREEFSALAKDFLAIPDLTRKEYRNRFIETKLFDELLNTAVFTYIPVNPEEEDIQRQEILVTPQPGGDKVKSIIIDQVLPGKDGPVQKRMLWQTGKSFLVTTITRKADGDEQTHTLKVIWNDYEPF